MKYFIFVLALSFCVNSTAHANAIDWANGAWGIDVDNVPEGIDAKALDKLRGCATSPVWITADRDTLRYTAVHSGEEGFKSESPILSSEKRWISLQYDGETRRMKNGDLQMWHMVFVSEDKFYWVLGKGVEDGERESIVPTARVRCKNFIG